MITPHELLQKRLFVVNRANSICAGPGPKVRVTDFAEELNGAHITTNDGKPFKGLRGTHQLLRAVVIWLRKTDRPNKVDEEQNIRDAFEPSPWKK